MSDETNQQGAAVDPNKAAQAGAGEPGADEGAGQAAGQPDYKAMYEKEKAEKEEFATSNTTLKEQLRTQSIKHDKTPQGNEAAVPADVIERLAKVEQRFATVEEKEINDALVVVKANDWYAEHYTGDNDPDGKKVARLSEALKAINALFPPTTVEIRAENYLRAHRALNPNDGHASLTQKINDAQQGNQMKSMAGGAAGGSSSKETNHVRPTAEEIRMAELCGNDPAVVAQVKL